MSKSEYDQKIKSGEYREPKKVNEHGLYSVKNWKNKEIEVVVGDDSSSKLDSALVRMDARQDDYNSKQEAVAAAQKLRADGKTVKIMKETRNIPFSSSKFSVGGVSERFFLEVS